MKNLLKKGGYLFLAFLMINCQDEEKLTFTDHTETDDFAPYVRIIVEKSLLDATVLGNESLTGTVSAPSGNVTTWNLMARVTGSNTTEYADITTVSSFPSDISIPMTEIADKLNIAVNDIQPGDIIEFQASSTGNDGRVLTIDDLAGDLSGQPEQRQAYEFEILISCPFKSSEIAGTFNVVEHSFDAFFGEQPPTREIIAGPGENQLTIIGGPIPLDGSDDLVINVDPATGVASYGGNDNAIHFNTFGPGVYGTDVKGFVFSCVGSIDLVITSPGFISNTFTLKKN